jgi:hypothetical protein
MKKDKRQDAAIPLIAFVPNQQSTPDSAGAPELINTASTTAPLVLHNGKEKR